MFFPKYIYQLRKVQSGFFFVLRTGNVYMNLLQHYFLENLCKNSNGEVIKIWTSIVCFREGEVPSNWTDVDREGGGVKKICSFYPPWAFYPLGLFHWHICKATLSCKDDTKKSDLMSSWRSFDVISQSDMTKDPKIRKIVKIVSR